MNYINHNIAGLFILTLVLIAICFWYLFIPQTILIEYSASIMTTGSLMLLLGYLNTKKTPSKSYNFIIWVIILFISYLIIRLALKQDLFSESYLYPSICTFCLRYQVPMDWLLFLLLLPSMNTSLERVPKKHLSTFIFCLFSISSIELFIANQNFNIYFQILLLMYLIGRYFKLYGFILSKRVLFLVWTILMVISAYKIWILL